MQELNSSIKIPVLTQIMCSNINCKNIVTTKTNLDCGIDLCEKYCDNPKCAKFIRSPDVGSYSKKCNHDLCKRFINNGKNLLSEISIIPFATHYSKGKPIGSFAVLRKIQGSKRLFDICGNCVHDTNCVFSAAIKLSEEMNIGGFESNYSIDKFNEFFFSSSKKDYRYEITPARNGYHCIFYGQIQNMSVTKMNNSRSIKLKVPSEYSWFSFPLTTLLDKNKFYSKKFVKGIAESSKEALSNQKLDFFATCTLCLVRLRLLGK